MDKDPSAELLSELGSTLERARELVDTISSDVFSDAAVGDAAVADFAVAAPTMPATAVPATAVPAAAVQATAVPSTAAGGLDDEALVGPVRRILELEERLETVERDRDDIATRLVEAEHQLGRLMNLYVATFQLHATLDPTEVQATIAEIGVDLLGAERFVLLLRIEGTDECEVALARGLEHDDSGLYAHRRYHGGDPLIDAALEDGILRMGPADSSEVIAAVPLRVQDAIVGALVVTKLFDHKAILRAEDRDLLDLLAAHAASALFAARVYSNTDRKLRTLESLVQLVRGT